MTAGHRALPKESFHDCPQAWQDRWSKSVLACVRRRNVLRRWLDREALQFQNLSCRVEFREFFGISRLNSAPVEGLSKHSSSWMVQLASYLTVPNHPVISHLPLKPVVSSGMPRYVRPVSQQWYTHVLFVVYASTHFPYISPASDAAGLNPELRWYSLFNYNNECIIFWTNVSRKIVCIL